MKLYAYGKPLEEIENEREINFLFHYPERASL